MRNFSIRNAPQFEAWIVVEQERLRQQLISALQRLIAYFVERNQLQQAIPYAQAWVQQAPLEDEAHQTLLRLLWQNGQQSAALTQAEAYRTILQEELDLAPDKETLALFEQIQQTPPTLAKPVSNPTNLRPGITRFIGRSHETTLLHTYINDPTSHLITIVGEGGVGKSRLAVEVARNLASSFRDGAYLVSLAHVHDKNGLVSAIGNAIGFTFFGQTRPGTQLKTYLANKEMLLILDNFE